MTLVAIVCLIIHDIINVAVVTTFGVVHRFDDGFTYSQAFWMTVCATIASVTTTITLLLDYYRTPNFAKSGSGLTRKQRSLVIIFMVLLADLAVGALAYAYLLKIEYAVGIT
jgi:potassium channel subfamily K